MGYKEGAYLGDRDTEGVDVAFSRPRGIIEELGRLPSDASKPGHRRIGGLVDNLCETKVAKNGVQIGRDHNVGAFDIPMDDALAMQIC